jgi:hypothetical protein
MKFTITTLILVLFAITIVDAQVMRIIDGIREYLAYRELQATNEYLLD